MASYFRQVPNFDYVSRNSGEKYISEYITVKNLFKRGKLREDIFGNLAFFEKYSINGDERPDNVAYKFYNDETLDWIILLSNNILNIQTEWPMTQRTFDKVMLERYGSYEELYSGIHHYETEEIKNSLGITVLNSGIKINNTWKSNGNFLEIINSKIDLIYSGITSTSEIPTSTVTVEMANSISNLKVGDEIIVNNVADTQYNGKFIVSGVGAIDTNVSSFTYELDFTPDDATPALSTPRKEEILFTITDDPNKEEKYGLTGNSHYYEYWDDGLGYSVLVPSTSFVRAVTNYEYENLIQEEKRNIYILKPRYLSIVMDDLTSIMRYKNGSQQYVTETLKRGDNIRLYQ